LLFYSKGAAQHLYLYQDHRVYKTNRTIFVQYREKKLKNTIKTIIALMLIATSGLAIAQEEEAADKVFIYATYFNCNPALEEAADEQVASLWKPAYDAAVEAGTILDWGYYSHHTGGKWRRLQWYSAGSIADLLKAQSANQAALEEAAGEDGPTDFGDACPSHDDYIWELTNGSSRETDGTVNGGAVLSTYHVCSLADSDRADEIFANEFAPILDKHVEAGNLAGWGWLSHRIGGKVRRIETLTGKDMASLVENIGKVFADLGDAESGEEFDRICSTHSDYLWNVVH
jgi:hypothetical protein